MKRKGIYSSGKILLIVLSFSLSLKGLIIQVELSPFHTTKWTIFLKRKCSRTESEMREREREEIRYKKEEKD